MFEEALQVNRAEYQRIARDRIQDARVLLDAGRWSAAYYLAGYAVECGLKACIIAYLRSSDEFPERKFSEQCWTHNLFQLLKLASLETAFDSEAKADPDLFANWDVVKDWKESSRYARKTKAEAEQLFDAINDKKHGVLSWIRSHW
jgi:HEPN domain-containing protein